MPAFFDPEPRLELLDELGIEWAMMWPTLASLLEERLADDPKATHVVVHAFNQWMAEHWTYNFADRIFPTPVITLPIVDEAMRELDYVVERGVRAILVRPAPVPDYNGRRRSFALPEYDRFWQRVEEAGVLVGMHASDDGFQRYLNEWEGHDSEFLPFAGKPSAFSAIVGSDWRTVSDVVSSIIGHGLATRFPKLRFMPVENGSAWVRPLVGKLQKVYERTPAALRRGPDGDVPAVASSSTRSTRRTPSDSSSWSVRTTWYSDRTIRIQRACSTRSPSSTSSRHWTRGTGPRSWAETWPSS